jgi:hypothetical protein
MRAALSRSPLRLNSKYFRIPASRAATMPALGSVAHLGRKTMMPRTLAPMASVRFSPNREQIFRPAVLMPV